MRKYSIQRRLQEQTSFVKATTGNASWAGSPLNSMGGVGALMTMLALAEHPSGNAGSWTYTSDFPHGPNWMPTHFNESSKNQSNEIKKAWKNIMGTDIDSGISNDEDKGDITTKEGTSWECKHYTKASGNSVEYPLAYELTQRDAASGTGLAFYDLCKTGFGNGVFNPTGIGHPAKKCKTCPPPSAIACCMVSFLENNPAAHNALIDWLVSKANEGCLVSNLTGQTKFSIYWASPATVKSTFQSGNMGKFEYKKYSSKDTGSWTRPRFGFQVPCKLGATRVGDLYSLATETGDYTHGMDTDVNFFKQEKTRFVIKLINHIISSSSYKYTSPTVKNWWGQGQEPFRAAWLKKVIEANGDLVPDKNMTVKITRDSIRFPEDSFEITKKWSSWANKRNSLAVYRLLQNDKEYSMSIAAGQGTTEDMPEPTHAHAVRPVKPMGTKAGRTEMSKYNKLKGLSKSGAPARKGNAFSTQKTKLTKSWVDAGYSNIGGKTSRVWDAEDFDQFAESKLYKFHLSELLFEQDMPEKVSLIDEIPEEYQYLVDFIYDTVE